MTSSNTSASRHSVSQLGLYFAKHLSLDTSLIPAVKGSNGGNVILRQGKEFWVEDGRGPLYRPVTIGALPDDALLEILSFIMEEVYEAFEASESVEVELLEQWYTLVHVCRRWRNVVFASRCRLNLQLICSSKRPVRKMLNIWPALPLIVNDWHLRLLDSEFGSCKTHIDNVVAALECCDRVRHISLGFLPDFLLKVFAAVMQESFPALTYLELFSDSKSAPALPDSFLGGSAPRLRSLTLECIPFPGLPTLLLTTNNLVGLSLIRIPYSGYISPEAMARCLSSLTKLRNFRLEFNSPRSRPDRPSRHPSSVTRVDLPALIYFRFRGDNEYLEQFVARFNAPLLRVIYITFFNRLLFDISQLSRFIGRVENDKVIQKAAVRFGPDEASVVLSEKLSENADVRTSLELRIKCTKSEWQLSSLADICSSSSSSYSFPVSSLERLDILPRYTGFSVGQWHDDMEDTQWLELLQPFTAVKDLYLCEGLALRVVQALQDLTGERATEMLPALQSIFMGGLSEAVQTAIGPFIASRQLSGHPVAVHSWKQ